MIVMTEDQLAYVEAKWGLMEPWADQVVAHNIAYTKQCLQVPKAKK